MREFAEDQDVVAAVSLANTIGIHPHELTVDNEMAAKFKEIADYMIPFENRNYIATKVTRGMGGEDAVNHLWNYVSLRKDYEATKQKYDELTSEIAKYE